MSAIIHLPTEIISEIFKQLIIHTKQRNHVNCSYDTDNRNVCLCWQLDILSVSMVCLRWYTIASCMIEETKEPWTALMNHINKQRMYPFRSRLVKLLGESRQSHLFFHLRIRHLTIDFLSSEANDKGKEGNKGFMLYLLICQFSFYHSVICFKHDWNPKALSKHRATWHFVWRIIFIVWQSPLFILCYSSWPICPIQQYLSHQTTRLGGLQSNTEVSLLCRQSMGCLPITTIKKPPSSTSARASVCFTIKPGVWSTCSQHSTRQDRIL